MEIKQIKELMTAMGRTGMKRLTIKNQEGFKLILEREEHIGPLGDDVDFARSPDYTFRERSDYALRKASHPQSYNGLEKENSMSLVAPKEEMEEGIFVTSPMVGTYYSSPSPDDPAFIKVGDKIDKNTVVCIIEAMKVMNEVKAGVSGVVAELLVDTAHPVEFGAKLFRIIPS